MGFWNKVKQGITQMTGGGGTMQIALQSSQIKKGESLNVTITLTATAALSGKSVNLEVNSVETVTFQVPINNSNNALIQHTTETKNNQLYHGAIAVDGAVNMQPGETKTYTATIPIPTNVQPTYIGTDAKHNWFAHAYLDVSMGADIDARADFTVA